MELAFIDAKGALHNISCANMCHILSWSGRVQESGEWNIRGKHYYLKKTKLSIDINYMLMFCSCHSREEWFLQKICNGLTEKSAMSIFANLPKKKKIVYWCKIFGHNIGYGSSEVTSVCLWYLYTCSVLFFSSFSQETNNCIKKQCLVLFSAYCDYLPILCAITFEDLGQHTWQTVLTDASRYSYGVLKWRRRKEMLCRKKFCPNVQICGYEQQAGLCPLSLYLCLHDSNSSYLCANLPSKCIKPRHNHNQRNWFWALEITLCVLNEPISIYYTCILCTYCIFIQANVCNPPPKKTCDVTAHPSPRISFVCCQTTNCLSFSASCWCEDHMSHCPRNLMVLNRHSTHPPHCLLLFSSGIW